jgi:hypothetical protein
MTMGSRWRRVDAEHWVHRLLQTQTFLLTLWTMWTFVVGLASGFVVATLIPASIVALSGWLTSAWRRERAWAWWVATVLVCVSCVRTGLALIGGATSWQTPVLLVFDGLLLLFLLHPDSRARIGPRAAAAAYAVPGTSAPRP